MLSNILTLYRMGTLAVLAMTLSLPMFAQSGSTRHLAGNFPRSRLRFTTTNKELSLSIGTALLGAAPEALRRCYPIFIARPLGN
jgi:hypothetical protein